MADSKEVHLAREVVEGAVYLCAFFNNRAHPVVHVGNLPYRNAYFAPPKELLQELLERPSAANDNAS
jgi:hypothetical protein